MLLDLDGGLLLMPSLSWFNLSISQLIGHHVVCLEIHDMLWLCIAFY